MTIRTIATTADIEEGIAALALTEPRFAVLHAATGTPSLRRSRGGFEDLVRIIVEQMISLKAGEAIWARLTRSIVPFTAETVARKRAQTLMRLGLSGTKARSVKALARAIAQGVLDLEALHELDDDAARARLTAFHGIGPWTADIYLLSALGRSDVWPAADVALQSSVGDMLGLKARPGIAEMHELALAWKPWRAVAARLLWAHYRKLRSMPQAD